MAVKKVTKEKSACGEKVKKSFQAGMMIGRNMKKPIAKKKQSWQRHQLGLEKKARIQKED